MTSRLAATINALKAILFTPIALLVLLTTAAAVVSVIWLLSLRPSRVGEIRTSADQRCEQVLYDLRDGNFAGVVAQLDAAAKAQLSADQLQAGWDSGTFLLGQLSGWKLAQSQSSGGLQIRLYDLTFEHGSLLLTIAVNGAGEVDELQSHTVHDSDPVTTPPYANPHAFKAESVTVGSPPNVCDGILTIPTAAHALFPAAVLVAGSGPNDKDESIGPNHPLADIAEGLSTRGIVMLRYDKRTYSHEKFDPARFTVEQEYLEDAAVAVALLRRRPDVDRNRIFIIGHSEGAVLAPEIAKRAAPVAGVIMLAPAAAPLLLTDIVIRQQRYWGAPPARIAEIEEVRHEINSGKLPPGQMVSLLGALYPVGYLTDLKGRDEIEIARHLGVPILIMHGGRDWQVVDQDIAAWRTGLKGTPNVTFREFPSLNHLFIAGTGLPTPVEYASAGHVDDPVVLAIADFIWQRPSIVSN
ncbi:MAG: alpha/beta fold hydrolase [Deltaproteobacteria bacterium]|nr:alpha/beta fold hydrolase [Deltaproteobacteria bacterium]